MTESITRGIPGLKVDSFTTHLAFRPGLIQHHVRFCAVHQGPASSPGCPATRGVPLHSYRAAIAKHGTDGSCNLRGHGCRCWLWLLSGAETSRELLLNL